MVRLRNVLPAILLALPAACLGTGKIEPEWVEVNVKAPTEQILWDLSLRALEKHGYPLGAALDRSGGRLVSGWKTSLAAFRSQGWREKAWIEFQRLGTGNYAVKVRVQRETNEDIIRPLDPSYAEWEPSTDDAPAARILMQTIRSYLGTDLELEDAGPAATKPPVRG